MTEPKSQDLPRSIDDAAQHWLLRLTSGVDESELEAFEEWCDADPRHRAAYQEVRALWIEIDALRPAFAPQGAPAPSQPAGKPARRAWRRRVVAGGLIAACLVLVAAAMAPHRSAGLLADHRTAIGEQHRVVLPDGSVAHLNTDTAIDVAYSEQRRRITLLYGEALFEVRKNAARPFDVAALGGRTTAVGTAFAVRDMNEAATVSVTEGAVRVASPSGADEIATDGALVEAGQQVSYRRGIGPGPVRALDAGVATGWRQGAIVIRDRPLAEALAEIGRYRAGRILLLGDATRYQPVTARIALADIDSGLDALAATHGLAVTRLTGYLVILH